jgi:hypothetical protein
MKRIALAFVLVALVAVVTAGVSYAEGTETLTGAFVWNNEDQTGDLEAIFTNTGEGMWDVAFHFIWEDEPHIWAGTAEGSLTEGELKGSVTTDGERESTFTFEGMFEGGKFSGTHGSMRDGEMNDTGTITLGR